MFEEENITKPWKFTEFLGINNKVTEPLYECKTEYEWIRELAKRIDLEEDDVLKKTGGTLVAVDAMMLLMIGIVACIMQSL